MGGNSVRCLNFCRERSFRIGREVLLSGSAGSHLTIIELAGCVAVCVATDSCNGWCYRHQDRRLCTRPHYLESVIFFRIFGIPSFYATATLLNVWMCMQCTDAADGGCGGGQCDVNIPSLSPRGSRLKAVANDYRHEYQHGCGLWTLVNIMTSATEVIPPRRSFFTFTTGIVGCLKCKKTFEQS